MMPLLRCSAAVALIAALSALGTPSMAEEEPPPTLPPRPLSASIARALERIEEEAKAPCSRANAEDVPCFPVATEALGPRVSVRDSLRELGASGKPSPNRPPTEDEMAPFRPGSAAVTIPLVSIDPVCSAKAALKTLKGKNDVYYLYRVRDGHGERVVLSEQRLNAASYQGALEFLGRYEGECEALRAYRREKRLP